MLQPVGSVKFSHAIATHFLLREHILDRGPGLDLSVADVFFLPYFVEVNFDHLQRVSSVVVRSLTESVDSDLLTPRPGSPSRTPTSRPGSMIDKATIPALQTGTDPLLTSTLDDPVSHSYESDSTGLSIQLTHQLTYQLTHQLTCQLTYQLIACSLN